VITVKISKLVLADPAKMQKVANALKLAQVMAEAVQERVMLRGETATTAKPYATSNPPKDATKRRYTPDAARSIATNIGKKRGLDQAAIDAMIKSMQAPDSGYSIGKQYAKAAGLDKTRFANSAEMHRAAGAKPGTFRVTGKMWEGLQVRPFGGGAVIEFGGSSIGKSSDVRTYRVKVKGVWVTRKVRVGAAHMVRNWQKAGVVFKHSRVNVVQPTDFETRDMIDGLSAALFDAITIITTDQIVDQRVTGQTRLAKLFLEALQ